MMEIEDAHGQAERRVAAGRVATWFGGELGSLLQILRRTVAEALPQGSRTSDQAAADEVLVAARACSARVGTVIGLRAEPTLSVSSNVGRELRTTIAEHPNLHLRGIGTDGLDSVELPLSVASLRTVLRELLANACEASSAPPRVEVRGASQPAPVELWVVNRGTLSPADASRAKFPFFTTKAGRRGLGLSASHIAVENQGGCLKVIPGQDETHIGVLFPGAAPSERESDLSFACHLAASLAHDVNNALMAALGWAEILGDARDEAERDEALATLSQAADYLEAMSYLLPYPPGPGVGAVLELGQAFERMRPLLRAVLEHKADRKIALRVRSVQGASVAMSEDALRSLVLRLAENARDAMPKGGTWTIACDVKPRELLLTLSAEVRGTDLSAGPRSSARAHGPNQAALGLAVVRDLVQAAGGSFEDASESPPNPSVRIRLPASPG